MFFFNLEEFHCYLQRGEKISSVFLVRCFSLCWRKLKGFYVISSDSLCIAFEFGPVKHILNHRC